MGDSSEPSSELDDSDAVKLFENYKLQRAQRELDLATYLQAQRTEELAILTEAYGRKELPEAEDASDHINYSLSSNHDDSISNKSPGVEDCTTIDLSAAPLAFQDNVQIEEFPPARDEALQREIERLNHEMMLEMKASSNVSQYIQTLANLLSFSSLVEENTEEHKARQRRLSVVQALSYSALARKHITLRPSALVPQLLPSVLQMKPACRSPYDYYHQLRQQSLTALMSDFCDTTALLLTEQRHRALFIKELALLTSSSTWLIPLKSMPTTTLTISSRHSPLAASVTSVLSLEFVELVITDDTAPSFLSSLSTRDNVFVTTLSIRGPFKLAPMASLFESLTRYFKDHPPLYLTFLSITNINSISTSLSAFLRLTPSLVSLTIDGCSLTSVSLKELELINLSMLLYLDLSNNMLDIIDSTLLPSNLVSLNLSNNRMFQFECSRLFRLQILKLGGNSFTELPPIHFLHMLTQVYLENNQITCLNFHDLSSNARLTLLSLNSNRITILNTTSVSKKLISLDSLEILTLKDNPLESICFVGTYFPKLQSLELSTFPPTLIPQLAAAYLSFPRLKLIKGDVTNTFLSDADMHILHAYLPRLEMLFDRSLTQRSQLGTLSINPSFLINRTTDPPLFIPNKLLLHQDKGNQLIYQRIPRISSFPCRYINSTDTITVCSERSFGPLEPLLNSAILQWPLPGRTTSALQSFEGSADAAFLKTIRGISALLGLPLHQHYPHWSKLKGNTVSITLLDNIFRLYVMLQRSERSFSVNSAVNKFTIHSNPIFIERMEHRALAETQIKVVKRFILRNKFYLIVRRLQNALIQARANLASQYQILKYRAIVEEERQKEALNNALTLLYPNMYTRLEMLTAKDRVQSVAQERSVFQTHLSRVHANMAALLEKCQIIAIVEAAQFLQSVIRAITARKRLVLYICKEVKRLKEQERCQFEETRMATQRKLELEFARLEGDDDDVTAWALKATESHAELDNILAWANDPAHQALEASLYDEELFSTTRGLRADIFSTKPQVPALPPDLALSATTDNEAEHSGPITSSSIYTRPQESEVHQPLFQAYDTLPSKDMSPPQVLSPPRSLFKHEAISIQKHSKKLHQPYIPKSRSAPRHLDVRPVTLAPAEQRSLEYRRRQALVKNADSLGRSHQDTAHKQHILDPILKQIKTDGWDLSPETAKTLALKRKKELAIARAAQASDRKRF
ncbi:Putative leucine-rich repeat protein [Giardia duodenalis]|uniref:Leucine-rich repeat protein n=2 Tax=Giardia intestinalis TaxID=5741 RepID=C6LUG2_GIAIB|nr:Hypothetical protein GL50581_2415 [Giardia intestinalis ATCC 50581]ESU42436.1 Putative leucine-rich repeat protein [Giardia intestinalis]